MTPGQFDGGFGCRGMARGRKGERGHVLGTNCGLPGRGTAQRGQILGSPVSWGRASDPKGYNQDQGGPGLVWPLEWENLDRGTVPYTCGKALGPDGKVTRELDARMATMSRSEWRPAVWAGQREGAKRAIRCKPSLSKGVNRVSGSPPATRRCLCSRATVVGPVPVPGAWTWSVQQRAHSAISSRTTLILVMQTAGPSCRCPGHGHEME